jgi:MurNAc alpha-1-phosphate uridylyltransferase
MKAMLLAAGRGERMGELTRHEPKPLLDIGGERLIVVINLSYRGDAIRAFIGSTSRWGQSIAYSEEGEPALETGGGIIAALPLLGSAPFIAVNADVVTDFDYSVLRRKRVEALLVLVPNPAHHPHGDFGLTASGLVTLEPPLMTFSGISVLSPELFHGIAPGRQRLRPILESAIAQRRVEGVRHEGLWHDIGTPERLAEARHVVGTPGR